MVSQQSEIEAARMRELESTVKHIAENYSARLPSNVDIDDLLSEGRIGALQSVRRFDPSKNVLLKTYAARRIVGAITDYLRTIDPLKREAREQIKRGERADVQILSLDAHAPDERPLAEVIPLQGPDVLADLIQRGEAEQLFGLLGRGTLSARVYEILRRYYFCGQTLKVIASQLGGVHESRVSQLLSKALGDLRQMKKGRKATKWGAIIGKLLMADFGSDNFFKMEPGVEPTAYLHRLRNMLYSKPNTNGFKWKLTAGADSVTVVKEALKVKPETASPPAAVIIPLPAPSTLAASLDAVLADLVRQRDELNSVIQVLSSRKEHIQYAAA